MNLRTRTLDAVARRPVTTAVGLMLVVGWSLMIPAVLAGLPVEPFLLATVLVGQLGGAVLVASATGGRRAVRALFTRAVRWRVRPGLWALALLGTAVPSLALVTAVFGPGALRALVTAPSVATGWLSALTILPVVNLWEELSWTGTIQSRLMARHGLVRGAAATAPFFALVHLPLQLGRGTGAFVTGMAVLLVVAVPFRIVVGRLYELSGGSVLLVAVFHAAFNATNNGSLLVAAAPQHEVLVRTAPWVVVGLGALLVVAGSVRRARRTAPAVERTEVAPAGR